jgi:hypothetical protein
MRLEAIIDAEIKELEKALENVRKRLRAQPPASASVRGRLEEERRELERQIGELKASSKKNGANLIDDTEAAVGLTFIQKLGEAMATACLAADPDGDGEKVLVASRILRRVLASMVST